ncbi:MAG: hypothetical protein VW378_03525 [bacterium]
MIKSKELTILKLSVAYYLKSRKPISSHALKSYAGLSESTATIRNVLLKLSHKGFYSKSFTSAGRVPTDYAYRFLFDGNIPVGDPVYFDRQRLLAEWKMAGVSIGSVLNLVLKSLSLHTKACSFFISSSSNLTCSSLRFHLVEARVLAVYVFDAGHQLLRYFCVDLKEEFTQQVLDEMSQYWKTHLSLFLADRDTFLTELNRKFKQFVPLNKAIYDGVIAEDELLFKHQGLGDLCTYLGTDSYDVCRWFDDEKDVYRYFDRCCNLGTTVRIGAEHEMSFLQKTGILLCRDLGGIYGIIGPRSLYYTEFSELLHNSVQLINDFLNARDTRYPLLKMKEYCYVK